MKEQYTGFGQEEGLHTGKSVLTGSQVSILQTRMVDPGDKGD